MKNNDIFYCTRGKLYAILVEAGYTPFNILPNYYNPKLKVWMFKRTEELNGIVEEFYDSLKEEVDDECFTNYRK